MIYGLHGVPAPASQAFRDDFYANQGTPGQQQTNGLNNNAPSFTPGQPSTPTTQHAGLNTQQTPQFYQHGPGNTYR
jgi:CCR4-NOT transcription complex subunit 7/8